MPLILPGNVGSATAATGFNVANSCRFNGSDSVMSVDTGSASTNKVTISAWVKKSAIATDQWVVTSYRDNNNRAKFGFGGGDALSYFMTEGGTDTEWNTTALFRDPSAWYHILLQADNTQGTFANRAKLYVNGVVMATSSSGSSTLNSATAIIGNGTTAVGDSFYGSAFQGNTVDGYLAEVVLVQGSILAPTAFGEFDDDSGIWKPIDITDTVTGIADYSFYLDFEDSSNLGNNASDSGLADLTEANLAAVNQSTDTCTNNFSTMNPLDNFYAGATFSEGNLKFAHGVSGHTYNTSNIGVANGRWYCEMTCVDAGSSGAGLQPTVGIASGASTAASEGLGAGAYDWGWRSHDNLNVINNNSEVLASMSSLTDGDIAGIYIDCEDNKLYFSKNGTLENSTGISLTATASTDTGFYFFAAGDNKDDVAAIWQANFGSPASAISSGNTDDNGYGNFEYSPNITGDSTAKSFYAVCTKNLAEFG